MNQASSHTIQRLTIADLLRRPDQLAPLVELARPYYEDPFATVRSAADRSDAVYLASVPGGEGGAPIGCFFVSWRQAVEAPAPFVGVAYGGLAVTREDSLGGGVLRGLLEAWRDDARVAERTRGALLMWGMTCLPFVLELAHDVFADVCPQLDGTHDDTALALAKALSPNPAREGDHPFVLRRATFSRYRRAAWDAMSRVQSGARVWMDGLGLEEERGDRLLFHFRAGA